MKTLGVIPARYASTRFPAKVLANIAGKPMIQHVWERARRCEQLDDLLIACDHADVLKAAKSFGANAVMTDPNHASGSDRIAEAVGDINCDLIVNIQGDEPFIDPQTIDDLVMLLKTDDQAQIGTVIKEIADEAEFLNPNVVKCVVDIHGYALYFSRAPIPFNRGGQLGLKNYKHLGLYAYHKYFLLKFKEWPKSPLENAEQLEQLRVLENGHRIKTVVTHSDSMAVDTPEDLIKAQEWLKRLS